MPGIRATEVDAPAAGQAPGGAPKDANYQPGGGGPGAYVPPGQAGTPQ